MKPEFKKAAVLQYSLYTKTDVKFVWNIVVWLLQKVDLNEKISFIDMLLSYLLNKMYPVSSYLCVCWSAL